MFIMLAGVGIIGALASILASLLVGSSAPEEEAPEPATVAQPATTVAQPATTVAQPPPTVEQELATIKTELAALRQLLEKTTGQRK